MRVSRIVALLACGVLVTLLVVSAADGPAARTIVVNEVELNPNGLDRDAEWVELLNVGSTSVDVAGWSLSYDYPLDGAETIATESLLLRPGQRFIFRYEGLRLRNDANTVIRLLDAAGVAIDETPALYDVDDDGKTWQRIPDGGDPLFPLWLQRDATRNAPNE
jgi:hypothetical protein